MRPCPRCGGFVLRRSRSGWLRHLARLVSFYPVRCESCDRRFWRLSWSPPDGGRPSVVRKVRVKARSGGGGPAPTQLAAEPNG